jgi:flagellar motor switch protein FliN
MAQLTAEQIDRTIESCRAHLAEAGETFRAKLDCPVRLTAGDSHPYTADAAAVFDGAGLAISFSFGEQGLVLLVPDSIPLPAWYREPGLSENNRLQTFAHELSLLLLPADLQADRYAAAFAPNLKEFAERTAVNPSAQVLDVTVFPADAAETDAPLAKLLLVVPVDGIPKPEPAAEGGVQAADDSADANIGAFPDDDVLDAALSGTKETVTPGEGASPTTGLSLDQALRALRILNVPVTVSVRLAERKMPLGQIVALAPGALVPFTKSCEELLDLFVNNHRYCQGEAIKIGEHFGIKIAKVGVTEERKERVL